ncbi:lysine 2,3-aminomutase, partial [Pseudoalteromonas sp. GABNS16H]|nr:lysine 2,3-aminomutase [Pseudoalteromonas sp. GABNS16H]
MNSIVTFPNRIPTAEFEERRFKVYTDRQLDKIDVIQNLPEETLFEMKVVASVLPFRVNEYVINELIDWN